MFLTEQFVTGLATVNGIIGGMIASTLLALAFGVYDWAESLRKESSNAHRAYYLNNGSGVLDLARDLLFGYKSGYERKFRSGRGNDRPMALLGLFVLLTGFAVSVLAGEASRAGKAAVRRTGVDAAKVRVAKFDFRAGGKFRGINYGGLPGVTSSLNEQHIRDLEYESGLSGQFGISVYCMALEGSLVREKSELLEGRTFREMIVNATVSLLRNLEGVIGNSSALDGDLLEGLEGIGMTDWPRFATVVSLTYQALLIAAGFEDSLELDSRGEPARKLGLEVSAKGNDLAAVIRGPRDFVPDEIGSLMLGPTKAAVVSAYFFSYVFDNGTTVYGRDTEALSRIVGRTGPCSEADRAGTELLNYSRASFATKFLSRDELGYSNGVVLLSVTASMVAAALLLALLSKCLEPGTTARDVMTTAILGCDGFSGGDDVSSMGPVIVGVLELECSYHVQIANADEKAAHAPDYATKIAVLEPGEEIDIGKPVR